MAFPSRLNEQQHRQIANALMTGQDNYPAWFQRHDRDLLSALADRWEMNGINGIHDMTESKRSADASGKPKFMMLAPKSYDD